MQVIDRGRSNERRKEAASFTIENNNQNRLKNIKNEILNSQLPPIDRKSVSKQKDRYQNNSDAISKPSNHSVERKQFETPQRSSSINRDQRTIDPQVISPVKHFRANSEYSGRVSVQTQAIEEAIKNQEIQLSTKASGLYNQNKNDQSLHKRNLSLQDNDYLNNKDHQQMNLTFGGSLRDTSPVAKHYNQILITTAQSGMMNSTFNRRLKMRDTFTKIFPNYTHGQPTCYQQSMAHVQYVYPSQFEGKPTADIDRTYTHKLDFLKTYTEEILKIANMRRSNK